MFSWLSSFMISQEKESWAREEVMRATICLNTIMAERDDVYRMLEASGFVDPELSSKHIGLACSVAATDHIIERLLKHLPADERGMYKMQHAKAKPPIRLKSD